MNRNRLFKEFRDGDNTTKRKIIVKILVIYLICFLVIDFCISKFFVTLSFNKEASLLKYMFNPSYAMVPSLLIAIVVSGLLIFIFYTNTRQNKDVDTDDRGIDYKEKGILGTARWLTQTEAAELFSVKPIDETRNTIFGQFGTDGTRVISRSDIEETDKSAKHCLIIGLSGSGKSYSFFMPNIINSIRFEHNGKGTSIVITDPSTELYCTLSTFARNEGYNVKILNLKYPDYSDTWNILADTCLDPDTLRVSEKNIDTFISVLQANANNIDTFWKTISGEIVASLIAYIAYKREKAISDNLLALMFKMDSKSDIYSSFSDKVYDAPFPELLNDIRTVASMTNQNMFEIEDILKDIMENSSEYQFNVRQLMKAFHNLDAVVNEIYSLPESSIAKKRSYAYKTAFEGNPQIRTSAVTNTHQLISAFDRYPNTDLLSLDGIKLRDTTLKKTIYFICTEDSMDGISPVASLFFSYLFKMTGDLYDFYEHSEEENPCLPLEVYLDEAASLGKLYNWKTVMSDSRKRDVRIYACYQYFSAIEGVYGQFDKDSVIANSSTVLFFGGNDPSTLKFVKEHCAGTATVAIESHTESAYGNVFGPTQYHVSLTSRDLLTADECRRMPKRQVLVAQVGKQSLLIDQLPLHMMKPFKDGLIKKCGFKDGVKPVKEVLKDYYDKHSSMAPEQVSIRIDSIGTKGDEVVFAEKSASSLDTLQSEIDNYFINNTGSIFDFVEDLKPVEPHPVEIVEEVQAEQKPQDTEDKTQKGIATLQMIQNSLGTGAQTSSTPVQQTAQPNLYNETRSELLDD